LQGRGEVSAPALQEAQRYCNEAAKLQPNLPEALYEAGQLALARKAYPEAAKLFEAGVAGLGSRKRGLTWTPSLPGSEATLDAGWLALFSNNDNLAFELRYAQAEALREVGQTAQAQKVWLGLLKTLDEQAEEAGEKTAALRATQKAAVNYQLGLSLLATQNYQESLPYLGEAVSHEPKNAAYHLGLAKALQAVGNPERALYELNQARELDPSQVEVYAELAELQLATKAKALDTTVLLSSLNLYSKALEIQPANTAYLYRAALLAYHLHYQNQATELIKRLLDELKVQSSKFNTSTGAGAQSPVSVAEAHLLAACNFERGGELNRARTEISLALTHPDPTKPDYFVVAARLARKANMLGNMEQALEALKEREKLPLSLQAAIRAEEGWLALARNRYQEAANFYQQAITLYQQSQRNGMAVKLDELYHEDGGFGLSSTYDQALLATYKFAYARALRQLHQYEPACRELDEAIKLNPRFAEAHVLRGEMLVEQGKFLAALESLKIAAELEPNPARFYELGKTYLKVEKPALAAEALKQAGSREIAGKSEYYNYLGLAYEKSGNNSAARAAYSCGLQIDPNSPDLHQALARCYLNEGERLAAVQPLQGAVVSEPANPVYRLALAQLYEELGWWQEAASEYEQAATLNPTDPQAWLKTGQLLVRTGRTDQGRAALEQSLRLNENLAEAHYELGKLYLDSYSAGQDEQAKLPPDLSGMYGPANEEMPAVSKPLEVIKG
jgi:tetratricopeptide (TPR) repeat protein